MLTALRHTFWASTATFQCSPTSSISTSRACHSWLKPAWSSWLSQGNLRNYFRNTCSTNKQKGCSSTGGKKTYFNCSSRSRKLLCPLRMAVANSEVAVSCVQLENTPDKTMCQAELANSCRPSVHISNSPLTWSSIYSLILQSQHT